MLEIASPTPTTGLIVEMGSITASSHRSCFYINQTQLPNWLSRLFHPPQQEEGVEARGLEPCRPACSARPAAARTTFLSQPRPRLHPLLTIRNKPMRSLVTQAAQIRRRMRDHVAFWKERRESVESLRRTAGAATFGTGGILR